MARRCKSCKLLRCECSRRPATSAAAWFYGTSFHNLSPLPAVSSAGPELAAPRIQVDGENPSAGSLSPEPQFFVWRGKYRAEFVALDAARAWQREHGGALAWLCDHCGEEHIGAKACCVCHGHFAVEDGDGGAGYCACPAAQAKSDEDAAYWEGQLRGVPARNVFNERHMAENGIDPDEVAVPR